MNELRTRRVRGGRFDQIPDGNAFRDDDERRLLFIRSSVVDGNSDDATKSRVSTVSVPYEDQKLGTYSSALLVEACSGLQ
jgi:hypothetical protein